MVAAKKKIKDYLNQSLRKLKHRKGFGVHSPFAYSIITEVIEEKTAYYAYRRMQPTFDKQSPIPFKVACLLLRLANRFNCREVAELRCDGGYSLLPLILTDSHLHVHSLASDDEKANTLHMLTWLQHRMHQVNFASSIEAMSEPASFDMILLNSNPFAPAAITKPSPEQKADAARQLVEWVMAHSRDNTVIFVRGIQPGHSLEHFWDQLCDNDEVSITMDLYDFGLAILKPRFFKQHYIVSF